MGELLKGFQLSDVCTDLAAHVTYLLHLIATLAALIQHKLDGPNTLHVPSCRRGDHCNRAIRTMGELLKGFQ